MSRSKLFRAAFAGLVTLVSVSVLATHAVAELQNPGFEEPVGPGGSIPGWSRSAVEQAVVTDGDDGADYGVYATLGISVPPLEGNQQGRQNQQQGQQVEDADEPDRSLQASRIGQSQGAGPGAG